LGTVFQRLSSGQRINKASDDAAGLSIADSLNAKSRIYNQGVRNLNDGQSLLSIADSAIEVLGGIVIRLEELAAQSANGVYTNKQRKALDAEAQALSKEFFRISKATEFNGQRMFTGELQLVNLQAGVGSSAVLSAGIGGDIGTGRLKLGTFTTLGTQTNSLVLGDFNGDGHLDTASADYGNTTSVVLGRGDGTFGSRTSYTSGSGPVAITTADFNGDGVLDLASVSTADNRLNIQLGNGNGTFRTRTSYQVGNGPLALQTADFNGDGKMDVITADESGSVLLGAGDGTFLSRTAITGLGEPNALQTGDVNGDGVADFIIGDDYNNTLSVHLGNGNGTFKYASYAAGGAAVELGDFNGDGALDIADADGLGGLAIFINNGSGAFVLGQTPVSEPFLSSVESADLNGDGFFDLITSDLYFGSVSVFLGNGNGTFQSYTSYTIGASNSSVQTGDVNEDGVIDIVSAVASSNGAQVHLGVTKDGVAPLLPFSLKTLADARQALPVFKRKREQLAAQRGEIGAFQSRVDVAKNVLEVSSENFKAAESRIRDADIADESSRLVRLNILQQAAASVLAQANQQPALALQLLGG